MREHTTNSFINSVCAHCLHCCCPPFHVLREPVDLPCPSHFPVAFCCVHTRTGQFVTQCQCQCRASSVVSPLCRLRRPLPSGCCWFVSRLLRSRHISICLHCYAAICSGICPSSAKLWVTLLVSSQSFLLFVRVLWHAVLCRALTVFVAFIIFSDTMEVSFSLFLSGISSLRFVKECCSWRREKFHLKISSDFSNSELRIHWNRRSRRLRLICHLLT
jgi:hypothetical protein